MTRIRRQVELGTYQKVKEVFDKNKDKEFSLTNLRDQLKIDYDSVIFIVGLLMNEKYIKKIKKKYKLRRQ
jgi:hypothetical protein